MSNDLVLGRVCLEVESSEKLLTLFFRVVGNIMSKIFTIKATKFFVITVRRGMVSFTALIHLILS